MSLINTTILELSSQGFFCICFYKKFVDDSGKISKDQTFSHSENKNGVPSATEFKSRCIPPEKWRELFELPYWKRVDRVAVVAGRNGVLAFDFDIKHFAFDPEKPEEYDEEKYNKAWQIWNNFKSHLEINNIPYYLEKSRSGGEHVILLCNPDVENFQPVGDICPFFGKPFIECFARKRPSTRPESEGKESMPQSITIAPSEGYKRLSEVSLLNLQRINSDQRELALSFFASYQKKDKEKQTKNIVKPAKTKKEPKEFKHNLTSEEIYEYIRRDHDLITELEGLGYTCDCKTNRVSRPGKPESETDIDILDGGRKIKCYANTDVLYNNGKPCDVIDVLRIRYGDDKIKELYVNILKQYSPHQMTPKVLNANTDDQLISEIRTSSKDRIVMNVYESPDKSETIIEAKTINGATRFFDLKEFLGIRLEYTGAAYFESTEYRTPGGSFSPLKNKILDEKLSAPRKLLLETSGWIDGRFYYKSSDECYIRNELFENSEASFEDWKTKVFDVGINSPGTALGLLMGFAAPFADILHQSFGVNLVGDSNIGKTMSLRIAKGMFKDPDQLESWRGTISAIEIQKLYSANGVLCLDEMYHADENALGSIMQLCGVTERKRCSWDGSKLNMAKSNEAPVLILSTSEIPFLQAAKRCEMQVTKGQLNRFLDLNVTKSDFPPSKDLTEMFHAIKKTQGVAIAQLCECLRGVDVNTLQDEFKKFSEKYNARLSGMSFATQRSLTHLMFLDFVAEFVTSKLKLEGSKMFESAKVLFERFLNDSQEVLEDGSALELNAVKEKLTQMLGSGKYVCRNDTNYRANDDTCFFTDDREGQNAIVCYTPKLISILTRDLNLSSKQVRSLLRSLDILGQRNKILIQPLDCRLHVYSIQNLDKLDHDTMVII